MYPVATEWLEEQVRNVKNRGYIKTWFGRVRRLPEIDSDDQGVRAEAERQAKNSPIQGQASDMNNAYLVRTVRRAKKEGIRCFPATTTHDENAFQVREEDVNKLRTMMEDVVATAFPDFRCRMELEFGVGKTLGTTKEL
jgi:DNA polymerase-1